MKVNEYKNEVRALHLSDEFKQNLKEMMLAELESQTEIQKQPTGRKIFVTRYSKYIALAACLLLVVSTMGIVSLTRLTTVKSDSNESYTESENAKIYKYDTDSILQANQDGIAPSQGREAAEGFADGNYVSDDMPNVEEAEADDGALYNVSEDADVLEDTDGSLEIATEVDGQDKIDEEVTEDEEVAEEDVGEYVFVAPEPVSEPLNPTSGPDSSYDGNYISGNYILSANSPDGLQSTPTLLLNGEDYEQYCVINSYLPDISTGITSNGDEDTPTPASTYTNEIPQLPEDDTESGDSPVESPAESNDIAESNPCSSYDEVEDTEDTTEAEPLPDNEVDEDVVEDAQDDTQYTDPQNIVIGFDLAPLYRGSSVEYYDVRDGVIADLDEVGFIRFRIDRAYDGEEAWTAGNLISFVPERQTIYKITAEYDYFNSTDIDIDLTLLANGSKQTQLIGRPVMEEGSEYIAIVYPDDQGVLRMVPELVYAVHEVNGLDIAYHVYSDTGWNVNPGQTDMGLLEVEQVHYTSSANNPEVYTQKAEVRELTYYIRRNILRMDPKLIDFEALAENGTGLGAVQGKLALTASFKAGRLVLTVNGEQLTTELLQTMLSDVSLPTDEPVISVELQNEINMRFTVTEQGARLDSLTVTSPEAGVEVYGIYVNEVLDQLMQINWIKDQEVGANDSILLKAHEDDGGWSALIQLDGGVVSNITVTGYPITLPMNSD